jgi:predicted DNA-binding transcriptional regulator AlpA
MSRWLNEKQAAEKTGLSLSKLRNDRSLGQGFPCSKWGRNVRYREEDIDTYLEASLVTPGVRSRLRGGRR